MTSLPASLVPRTRSVLREGVARGTAGTLALNLSATGLNFLVTLALTNALGASGYGAYAFAFAWSTVLTVPAVLGLSPLIVRNVAQYHVEGRWGLLRGILRHSHLAILGTSLLVAGVAAGVGVAALGSRTHLLYPFLIGLLLVPLLSLTTMRQAAMQGLGKVVIGRLPETIVAPAGFLALVVAGWVALGDDFSASLALAFQAGASAIAFVLGLWLLRRAVPRQARSTEPRYETRDWVGSAVPLVASSLFTALGAQLATILLGILDRSSEAGIYNAASRAALFVSFLFLAASYAVNPAIARLQAQGRHGELQQLLSRSVRLLSLASAPVAIAFFVFAPQVLAIFGGGFEGGVAVLRILVIGEMVRVVTGFAWSALIMAKRERDVTLVAGVTLGLNGVLSAILIPSLGAPGAAIATAISLVITQLWLVGMAWTRLSLATALGQSGRTRSVSP